MFIHSPIKAFADYVWIMAVVHGLGFYYELVGKALEEGYRRGPLAGIASAVSAHGGALAFLAMLVIFMRRGQEVHRLRAEVLRQVRSKSFGPLLLTRSDQCNTQSCVDVPYACEQGLTPYRDAALTQEKSTVP